MSNERFAVGQAVVVVEDGIAGLTAGSVGIVAQNDGDNFLYTIVFEGVGELVFRSSIHRYLRPVTLAVNTVKRFEIPKYLYEKHESEDHYDATTQQIERKLPETAAPATEPVTAPRPSPVADPYDTLLSDVRWNEPPQPSPVAEADAPDTALQERIAALETERDALLKLVQGVADGLSINEGRGTFMHRQYQFVHNLGFRCLTNEDEALRQIALWKQAREREAGA